MTTPPLASGDSSAATGPESDGSNRNDLGVSVHETAPDQFVFTETDNQDGWIATDLTVELRP